MGTASLRSPIQFGVSSRSQESNVADANAYEEKSETGETAHRLHTYVAG